ncbi:MAG: tetratricopeptide repeat protein [Aquabacterium sp.]|nr:tetratricopeptide repeat protein [Aquabacterium sp.]
MKKTALTRLIASVLVAAAWPAHAEIMDEVYVRRDGNNAIVQIRMTSPVSLLRATSSRNNDLTQAYYQVRRGDAPPVYVAGERRVIKTNGLPTITVDDEPVRSDNLEDPNRRLVIKFSQATRFKVRMGRSDRQIELVLEGLGASIMPDQGHVSSQKETPIAEIAPIQPPAQQAQDWLLSARQAYEQQRLDDAVKTLNQLLELPASALTPEAQEMLGMARLAQGDTLKAQAEFESYLKQFPTGPGAERVRAVLAGLSPTEVKPDVAPVAINKPESVTTVTGSISQYFYGGKSTFESQAVRDTDGTLLSPDEIDKRSKSPISATDQRLLSTNMDTTWRSRDADKDLKLVVRDQYDYNMLDESKLRGKTRHRNRLTAAYMDYQGLHNGLRSRLGRQSAMWGGEGRYDGGSASYAFQPKWKASVAAGVPTDVLAQAKRQFVGLSVDADALTPNIGASAFTVQRMIDGEVDRRSVGADLRYFTQNASVMATSDYDVLFKKLNVASLQGMYLGEGNTTVNVLYERRSLSPASLGQTLFFQFKELAEASILPQTINDLKRSGYSVAQLRELVRNNTSYWTHSMASITTPLNAQWLVGVDVHLNRTGFIAPNEVLPTGQAASGQQRTLGLQAIGSNLYSQHDTNVIAASLTNSSQFNVRQISYYNMTPLSDSWQIEPGLRWQRNVTKDFTTDMDITTTSWGPGFKASFRPRPSVTLESNLNVDYTRTVGVTTTDISTRYTYFLGYRYDY